MKSHKDNWTRHFMNACSGSFFYLIHVLCIYIFVFFTLRSVCPLYTSGGVKKYIRVYMCLGIGFKEKKRNTSIFCTNKKMCPFKMCSLPLLFSCPLIKNVRLIRPFVPSSFELALFDGFSIFLTTGTDTGINPGIWRD